MAQIGVPTSAGITRGPGQNVVLVETGENMLGITTMGPAQEAMAGENELTLGMPASDPRALLPMYLTPLQAFVLLSSRIETIEDLDGKPSGTSAPTGSATSPRPAST